jgi:hypothetical protein
MVVGIKYDFPPLLGPGRHNMTLSAVKANCVFSGNKHRLHLFQCFESMFQQFLVLGIVGEVWVNGSFLTEKPTPSDIDVAVIMPDDEQAPLSHAQRALMDETNNGKFGPAVDAFAWQWLPVGHPDYFDDLINPARTWHEQYGVENSGEWLKGFVVLSLG